MRGIQTCEPSQGVAHEVGALDSQRPHEVKDKVGEKAQGVHPAGSGAIPVPDEIGHVNATLVGQRLHDRVPVASVAGAPVGHDDGYAALAGHAICDVFAIDQD